MYHNHIVHDATLGGNKCNKNILLWIDSCYRPWGIIYYANIVFEVFLQSLSNHILAMQNSSDDSTRGIYVLCVQTSILIDSFWGEFRAVCRSIVELVNSLPYRFSEARLNSIDKRCFLQPFVPRHLGRHPPNRVQTTPDIHSWLG